MGGRWDQGFGFAGDASAVPIGDGDVAGVAEAAESGGTVSEAKRDVGRRHQVLESVDGADRAFGFEGGERVHFRPEVDGVAEFTFGDEAEPLMLFSQDEGQPFSCMLSR